MNSRLAGFIIFFSIFFTIFGLVNYYIFSRIGKIIPPKAIYRFIYISICCFLAFSFLIGRVIERLSVCALSKYLIWIGSFWMAYMVYLLLSFLLLDLIFFSDRFFNWMPNFLKNNMFQVRIISVIFITILTTIVIIAGYINSRTPVVKKIDFTISGKVSSRKSLNVVVASDIHLGIIISNSRLKELVDIINSLDADIVLMPGDIVDEDLKPVIENNLGETLKNIKSKYGTYAVPGNHEYIGGADAAIKYLRDHNIRVLRDEVVKINNAFYIAGRDDYSRERFDGNKRLLAKKLLHSLDKTLPVIMMDHQPFGIMEAVEAGVDVFLSGHTHHGQLWPFNYITSRIYTISHGYKKIENTHVYVSSGYGTWGPPVRTTSRSEIIQINIYFQNQ